MNYDDIQQQYQAFLDWLNSQQPMTDEQLGTAAGVIPGLQIFQQMQQSQMDNSLKQAQVEYGLAQLQNDFDMNSMQLEQARKQLEFQEGPYQDYLNQKTANDLAMSNNDVTQSNNNVLMSKDAVTRSGNDTLQSAYGLDQAKLAADVAKIKSYETMGFINPTHFTNMKAGY
jgi:hypothetical protein